VEAVSLTDFLLARIAEDEEQALDPEKRCRVDHVTMNTLSERALAECEAKRRLIDWSAPVSGYERVPTNRPGVYDQRAVRYVNEDGEDVLRYLALPYADHSDYRQEWKP
jgi:hypothetical protein